MSFPHFPHYVEKWINHDVDILWKNREKGGKAEFSTMINTFLMILDVEN